MITIPSPLHPAIVHFPIVLILIGAVVACAAVVCRRWNLPAIAAVCLSLGALGSLAATATGERDEEFVGKLNPTAENVLEEHEEWGKTARNAAFVAAALAIASTLLARFPIPARVLGLITALVTIFAAYAVAQTGHYGGQLVYQYGAGTNVAASTGADAVGQENAGKSTESGGKEDKNSKPHKEGNED